MIFGVIAFKKNMKIIKEQKYFAGSGNEINNLFALSIDLSILLKLMAGINPGISIKFVI